MFGRAFALQQKVEFLEENMIKNSKTKVLLTGSDISN
jgi:hypothetical protein